MPYKNTLQNAITYELSRDRHVHIRRVQSVLNRLAEIGGLFGALSPICMIIIFIVHYKSQYMFLMKELFVEPVTTSQNKFDTGSLTKKEREEEARNKMKNTT